MDATSTSMSIIDDKKAFTDIFNRENDSLFRFCLLRVSDRERALDLTQEAFVRLWSQMVSKKRIENPRAFLFAVARNLIIDWYRRIKSISLDNLSDERVDGREFDVADEGSLAEIEVHSDAKRVIAMINKLEPRFREVIYLRYVEDIPPKDIAEILKMSANTVSVHITRGMEVLRKLIKAKSNKYE